MRNGCTNTKTVFRVGSYLVRCFGTVVACIRPLALIPPTDSVAQLDVTSLNASFVGLLALQNTKNKHLIRIFNLNSIIVYSYVWVEELKSDLVVVDSSLVNLQPVDYIRVAM